MILDQLDPAEALAAADHFLQLAHAGRSTKSSTGERAAARVLNQIRSLSADWEDIDPSARSGAAIVLDMLASPELRGFILRRLNF